MACLAARPLAFAFSFGGKHKEDRVIILGIDPGLLITGYGVIEAGKTLKPRLKEAGVVRTKASQPISLRLAKIYENLSEIIEEYKPGVVVIEKLYSHYKHPVTSILMGHARGVICLTAGIKNIRLVSYPSTRIKKAVAGSGQATKLQIQGMVQQILGLKTRPEPLDVTDALACALTHVNIELR